MREPCALTYTELALFAVAGLAAIAMQTGLAIVGPCTSEFGAICLLSFILGFTGGTLCLSSAGVMYLWRHIKNRNFENRHTLIH